MQNLRFKRRKWAKIARISRSLLYLFCGIGLTKSDKEFKVFVSATGRMLISTNERLEDILLIMSLASMSNIKLNLSRVKLLSQL
jgi:hypothetical protein